jgi:hypothetical protein
MDLIRQRAITFDLLDSISVNMHDKLMTVYATLATLCFIIGVVMRFVEVVKSDSDAVFPIKDVIIQLLIVVILMVSFKYVLSWIIDISNTFAEFIFSKENADKLYAQVFPPVKEKGFFKIMSYEAVELFEVLVRWLANLAYFSLNIWRHFMLAILFLLAPIVFSLSLIPNYGWKHLNGFFLDCIQISSWIIIKSALDFMLFFFFSSKIIHAIGDDSNMGVIVLLVAYIVGVIKTPQIAARLFGGGDYSSLTTATAKLTSGLTAISILAGPLMRKAVNTPNNLIDAGKAGASGVAEGGKWGYKKARNVLSKFKKATE